MTKQPGANSEFRGHGKAYQGAMEAVFAVPVGLGLGYLGDRTFGTYPIWLLVGGVIGFAAFVVRMVRLGQELQPTQNQKEEPAARLRDEK